jgi:hypothetical protein
MVTKGVIMYGVPLGWPKVAHIARGASVQTGQSPLEIEMYFRGEGLSDFVLDQENDLFRFKNGRFAFSRARADVALLEERGYSA